MGPLTPRDDEEPFPDSGAARGPVRGFPAPDAPGGIHELRDDIRAEQDVKAEKADMDLTVHGMKYRAKQEREQYNQAMADRRSGKVKGTTGDPISDSAGDYLAGERKIAFAYGLGEIAHRLGSISEHQGDLFAASVRRYPQGGGGAGGGQWRPQRGVRERNIG